MIKLGDKIRDEVTGMVGIATARVKYLNGCIQYGLVTKVKSSNEKRPETEYFDVGRLKVIGAGVNIKKKPVGGIMSDAPKY